MAQNRAKCWKVIGGVVWGTEQIVKTILENRGLTQKEAIENFLNPPDPSNLTPKSLDIDPEEISKTLKRIQEAVKSGEQIIVYGDYDADGICGTAILWEALRDLGAKVLPYIPHRVEEGYGLSKKGIDNLLRSHKPSLIITVDHGITAVKEVEYAKKNGVEVVITDHHQKPKKLPQSLATIWTDQVSGAAVGWILAKELTKEISLKIDLGLVAFATIADLLPLKGANRSLVKFGLSDLNKSPRFGVSSLAEAAGLVMGRIGVWEVSFVMAPRINASGRIEHAMDSLRLLCTMDLQRARALAQKLDATNRERQRLTEEAFLHARALVSSSEKLIFISHSSYNEGVIGLVAGKLTEEFWKPAIVVAEGEKYSKASARSIEGFNIIETIRSFDNLLLDCGGHPMAAGFTVKNTRLEELKRQLLETAEKEITQEQLEKTLKIDCEVRLSDIAWPLYENLLKFEPFGNGNSEPVFLTCGLQIRDLRLVGNEGRHLKLLVQPSSSVPYSLPFSAIGFGLGERGKDLKMGDRVDLVYTLLVDSWSGEERLQLKIRDFRLSQ